MQELSFKWVSEDSLHWSETMSPANPVKKETKCRERKQVSENMAPPFVMSEQTGVSERLLCVRLCRPLQLLAGAAIARRPTARVEGTPVIARGQPSSHSAAGDSGRKRQTMLSLAMLDLEPLSEWFLSPGSNFRSCLPSLSLHHRGGRRRRTAPPHRQDGET